MKLNFYGPINRQGLIRTATINTFGNEDLTNRQETITSAINAGLAPGDTLGVTDTFEEF